VNKRFLATALLIVALSLLMSACGKKDNGEGAAGPGQKPTAGTAEANPVLAPKASKEEADAMAKEQEAIVQKAEEQEQQARKKAAQKVVTSSVAKSAPVPDGFPVQSVPIIQGAQIVSASKSGNTYNMVLRVNIPASDAYHNYFDLYDATGSVRTQTEGKALSIERAKNGLTANFTFENEGQGTSKITMQVVGTK
jgi:hypothetical protein